MRILQVVNNMHRAGLETMLMNYYRNINRDEIQFDFLTHRPLKSDYDDEILSLGGRIYYAPRLYPQNYISYFRYMKRFFAEHSEYRIVHSHIDAMSYLPLLAAKKSKIPVRIAHSHNTSIDKNFKFLLKQYFRFKIPSVANYYCACGEEAGKFLFKNKEFTVIPNAIEADHFVFDASVRKEIRTSLGADGKTVIGHVGRFSYQKNHNFLISLFHELHKKYGNTLLFLIGVGEKENEIKQKVQSLGLSDSVIFFGNRSDVNRLYQAMDVFLMPSLFEGVPVAGIEAQFSGLNCVFSDRVPKEVNFSGECAFLPLDCSLKKWVYTIMNFCDQSKREQKSSNALGSCYNIKNAHQILENYYRSFIGKE